MKVRKVDGFELGQRRINPRKLHVTIDARTPVTGKVLDDRQNTTGQKTLAEGAPESRHVSRVIAKRPIPNDFMRFRLEHIQNRRTVHRDPKWRKIGRQQLSQ